MEVTYHTEDRHKTFEPFSFGSELPFTATLHPQNYSKRHHLK
jgi:hypothetical protein